MLPLRLVLFMSLAEPFAVDVAEGASVDEGGVRQGVDVRLGSVAHDWRLSVRGEAPDTVVLELTAPDGARFERTLSGLELDPDTRAIEVASAATLVIEGYEPAVRETKPEPEPPPEREPESEPEASGLRGWIGVEPRVSFNFASPSAVSGEAALVGGMRLLDDRLRPIVGVSWEHARTSGLRVHAMQAELGMLAGVSLGRTWIGAGAALGGRWAVALDADRASRWGARVRLPAVIQVDVGERWVVGGQLGLGLAFPPLRFVGRDTELRWRVVRGFVGLSVGLRLGD